MFASSAASVIVSTPFFTKPIKANCIPRSIPCFIPHSIPYSNWSFFNKEFKQKALSPAVRAMGENWHLHPHFQEENFTRGIHRVNREVDEFFLNQGYLHDRENANFRALKKNEKRVAFFAHEGFAKAFFSSLLDIPYPVVALKTDMGHSGVTVVYFDEKEEEFFPRVMQWSDSSHLAKADLITPFQNWLKI